MPYKFLIESNNTPSSSAAEEVLRKKLREKDIIISDELDDDVDLIVCIGGDGAFLAAAHRFGFSDIPFLGINTGHLGFFQEISPEEIDLFIDNYIAKKYVIQRMTTAKAIINHDNQYDELTALNEIIVKSGDLHAIHFDISIGGSFIERFSGDGVLVSTPAGSTAYNYSLGGSIVDPRLDLLQVTPIAPMNTTAYRSFTSSLMLPPDLSLDIVPHQASHASSHLITYDSFGTEFTSVDSIKIMLSDQKINLLRFENYDFWTKVKTKFL